MGKENEFAKKIANRLCSKVRIYAKFPTITKKKIPYLTIIPGNPSIDRKYLENLLAEVPHNISASHMIYFSKKVGALATKPFGFRGESSRV